MKDAADGHRKLLKKGRKSVKHQQLQKKIWDVFTNARSKGHRVNFQWLMTKATTIQRQLSGNDKAVLGKHVIISSLKRYNIRMRNRQRNKKKSKTEKVKPLQQWYTTFRERCIRSGFDESYHEAWGRFVPKQRLNVDQSPLPFVINSSKTYEHTESGMGHEHNTWISQPGEFFWLCKE